MSGPLEGVRIVDLTAVLMGPYATQILGDYGADVIKVESPDGDVMRGVGPMRNPQMGPIFLNTNRNKRSIVLDLKQPAARKAVLRLARNADVFVYNVRPQAMERLGLGYAAVAAVNPAIVYAALVGFGSEGPYAGRPAYDDLIQGMAGIPSLMSMAGGQGRSQSPGEPRYAPYAAADRTVGLAAANAILAALFARERSGRGQAIEVPMFETMIQYLYADHLMGKTYEPPLGPIGYPRLVAPERKPYRTTDGYLCILVYTDRQWQDFFDLAGHSELKTDSRFADMGSRTANVGTLYALLADIVATRSTRDWMEALVKADIPCAPLKSLDEVMDDEHLAAVGMFPISEHPSEGFIRSIAPATRFAGTPTGIERHAPRFGEHTVEVLGEAGYDAAEIGALIGSGAAIAAAEQQK